MKKMSVLRWSIYLVIAALILIAVRWLAAPVNAKTAADQTASSVAAQSAQNSDWLVDLKKAQDEAKASHKLLLLNFTGSDWCGYCVQLDRAILRQQEFRNYASKNLVLVEIDFPRRKPQSIETRKQNQALAERFQIEGFPTLVLMSSDGKTLWRYDGMYAGGITAFLAELDRVRKS